MNELLQRKLTKLAELDNLQCWYLVKQPTEFGLICYLVFLLKRYKEEGYRGNIAEFVSEQTQVLRSAKPDVNFSTNYRALRVAAFFGLIKLEFDSSTGSYKNGYENAEITEVFEEINDRCLGDFEKTHLYANIIQRQIEKMFVSSKIDEQSDDIRSEYRLYPAMLLYKILIELGLSQGNYRISISEYKYLVVTTESFNQYLDTLLLIKLLREDESTITEFENLGNKFDNRLIQALKQLPTLLIDSHYITLLPEKISEVALKVFAFEQNPQVFDTTEYIDFLCSKTSLFELPNFNTDLLSVDPATVVAKQNLSGAESSSDKKGDNIILYGVPGVGKSHFISKNYCDDEQRFERIVFHPDYMNTDFIGQILPSLENGVVEYKFTAGAFTRILKKAHTNPNEHYYLIIEEINRGNAPAIFGEVFQLLDRDSNGISEYTISNPYISEEVYGSKDWTVRLPSNLTILATMNTADQNVFTLDTAFQRRWQMQMIENDIENCNFKDKPILDTTVSWGRFNTVVNNQILSSRRSVISSEDKRLGAYFIKKELLEIGLNGSNSRFAEKVLKYLWDDAFKLSRDDLFNNNYQSLDEIIKGFNNSIADDRLDIFNSDIKTLLLMPSE
ncbi:McrB family protein [Psychrobacter sp. H8-1]|uniref:McrB family protein n=1 Tax=Psychrobacter sp. H8-1 TaxID=2774129 RepID=UPI001917A4AC|nr:AAA family ATPase [Psychrobacter sp. H8-1]